MSGTGGEPRRPERERTQPADAAAGDLASPRVLRATLARYGLAPRKSLGQNFLIDANLRDKIVAAAAPEPGDLLVEVGPGPGTLTLPLIAAGAALLAVEADRGLAAVLRDRLPPGAKAQVIAQDILGLNLAEAAAANGWAGRPAVAVGNLPYYITTPVIFHLLDTALAWRRMVFLVQKEVARRMAARPGTPDYGLLSVMLQIRTEPEPIATMPPSVFWPPPKVDSTLVRLDFSVGYGLTPEETRALSGLARAAFGQRRKTLANACRSWAVEMALPFTSLCREAGIDPARRGESLTVGEFAVLARKIAPLLPDDRGVQGKS